MIMLRRNFVWYNQQVTKMFKSSCMLVYIFDDPRWWLGWRNIYTSETCCCGYKAAAISPHLLWSLFDGGVFCRSLLIDLLKLFCESTSWNAAAFSFALDCLCHVAALLRLQEEK